MVKTLFVFADVKRLLVEEYLDGKRRVCLNKEREIRKTRAGGFASNKYQRHVQAMKDKALDWIKEELNKPGVLRFPYDEIEINSENYKEEISNILYKENGTN